MTIFKHLFNRCAFIAMLLSLTIIDTTLFAQLTEEQQTQINQYDQLIKDYISKNQLKFASYYSNKKASVYLKAGSYQDAIDCYLKSVEYNDKLGNSLQNRIIYKNLA